MASMPAKLLAEFLGTYLLIFTVGCNVLSATPVWGGVSIACVLMVSIFAFGGISGANFNPAVSLALGINKNLEWKDVGTYCGVQLVAGIAAAFSYTALFGKSFALGPAKGFGIGEACVVEILYTFMLCFVVLNVAALKAGENGHCKSWFGMAIGFVIIAGAYGAGAISGGCFNPAVATGIAVSGSSFGALAPYFISELVGAGLAAGFFKVVRPSGEVVGEDNEKGEKTPEATLPSKLAAEFIGTFFLVLTVGLNVMAKSPAAAFSIACSLTCMICALGDVSGANFNPAVSLALIISGALDGATAGMYMAVQVLGGVVAACIYSALYGGQAFPLGPGFGFGLGGAAVAEIVYTMVLCLVVLAVAVKGGSPHFFPFAIGSCVTVGGFAIGSISGGSLNPAVSFGIASAAAVTHGTGSLINAVAYSVFEFIGAGIAAGIVMVTHAPDEEVKADVEDGKNQ
jgi:aquaporin Z